MSPHCLPHATLLATALLMALAVGHEAEGEQEHEHEHEHEQREHDDVQVDVPTALQWKPCGDGKFQCGDLYFCATNRTTWQYWSKRRPRSRETYGSLWPMPSEVDPNGSNGYLYAYHTGDTGDCQPGRAPIIRVEAGQKYKLTLHNIADMDYPDQPESVLEQLENLEVQNIWLSADQKALLPTHVTNLHIHGLHQSGNGDHDNVLRKVFPGKCLTYTYLIPDDAAGGTMWYHPHFHGKTVFQVFGGAYGMFIIEDHQRSLKTSNGKDLDRRVADFLVNKDTERTLMAYMGFSLLMGNGNPAGARITLTQGQWHRLRVSFVNPEGLVKWAEFLGFSAGLKAACEIREIAWDGVYASRVPYTTSANAFRLAVHGAGRVDFAVRCTTLGTFRLKYANTDPAFGTSGDVAHFTVVTGTANDATPYQPLRQSWSPLRPDHLQDLRNGKYPAAVKTVGAPFDLTMSLDGLNGKMFNVNVPTKTFAFGPETIHQVRYKGTAVHPTHMHQQHTQIVQPGGCGPALKEGEFYDTISVLNPDNDPADDTIADNRRECLVRFRMLSFSGRVIIHCHVLDHEDSGIMGWYNVPVRTDAFEASALFLQASDAKDCCQPRTIEGKVLRRGTSWCGKSGGYTTCNTPCALPSPRCGRSEYCTDDGKCVRVDRDAFCQAGDTLTTSSSSDNVWYPWIIAAVASFVAVVAVIVAVYCARVRVMTYGDLVSHELPAPLSTPGPSLNTPFGGAATPASLLPTRDATPHMDANPPDKAVV